MCFWRAGRDVFHAAHYAPADLECSDVFCGGTVVPGMLIYSHEGDFRERVPARAAWAGQRMVRGKALQVVSEAEMCVVFMLAYILIYEALKLVKVINYGGGRVLLAK